MATFAYIVYTLFFDLSTNSYPGKPHSVQQAMLLSDLRTLPRSSLRCYHITAVPRTLS